MSRVARILAVLAACLGPAVMVSAAGSLLREPERQLRKLFPNCTSWKVLDGRIGRARRDRISALLNRRLPFDELGTHRVYVPYRDGVPLGIVRVSCEMGRVGLVELVWVMDLDLRIRDLRIQKSREKNTGFFRGDAFREQLEGADLNRLLGLFVSESLRLDEGKLEIPVHGVALAQKIVWSGLKTLAIAQGAFGDELAEARLAGRVHAFFPATTAVSRLSRIRGLEESTPRELDSTKWRIARGFDEEGKFLGFVVCTEWAQARPQPEITWAVSPVGRVLSVTVVGRVDPRHAAGFAALRDTNLRELRAAGSATPAACGIQVLSVLRWNGLRDESEVGK